MAVRLQEDVSDLKKRVKRTEDVLQSLHSSLESAKFDNINERHESQGLTLDDLSPLVHSTPSPDVLLARGTVSQAQMCCSINRDQSVNSNLSASKLSTGLIDDASFREWKPLHPRAATPVSNIHGGFSKLKGDRQQTESQLHVERKQTLQAEDKMQSHILRLEAERDDALRNLSDVETALLDYRKHLTQTLQQKEQREEELVMQVQMLKGENQALRDKCWIIEGSKGELDHEKEKLDRLRGILSEAQRTLERDRREVDCVRQTLEHEKDKCQQDGLTLQRNKEHLNVDKQRLNEMIQKLESEQQNLDCTRITVETRQSEVNEERKLLDAETTSLHKERMALDALREDLNQKMAKLEMEKKYAEEERASLHKMRLQVDHQKEEQNEESSRCAEECAELEIGWKDLEKERKALESEIERHRECWGLGRELATFAERNLSGIETFLAHFVHNMSLTGPQSTKLMSWLKEARREQTANVAELEERLSEVVSQLQFKEMEIGKLEKELHEKTEAYVASASLAARYAPSARRDKEALRSAEQVVTNLRSENDCQTQELHELKGRMEVLRERTEAAETNAQCHKEELSHLREELQIIQRLHAEVLDEYQKELGEVKHMNSELKKTVSSCREKLKACTTSMERGRQDMDEERKRQHAETSHLRGELSDALSQQQETHASAQALQEMLDAVSAHGSLLEETQAKLRAQVSDLEKDVEHHRRLRVDEKSHTQAELAELQMQLKYRSQHLEQITATNGKLQADITAAQDEGERQHEAAEQSRKREEAAKIHAQQLQTEMEQLQERADKMELLDVEAKALRVDLVICAEETRIAEEEAVKARKEAQEALSTRDEAEEAVARAREALSGVEEKFTALNNQLRVSRDCANQRGKELDHLSAILHERQLELQQRSAQVLELEGRVSTRQVEMEVTVTNLQNVLEKTQKQVSVLKERQYKTERNLHDKCSELEKANNRNEKLTHNLEILEQDMLRERNHAEQLHQMSTDVRNRLEFLQLECSRLQTELEEMTRVCQEKELRQRHLAEELGAKQARICLLESRLQAEGSVLST